MTKFLKKRFYVDFWNVLCYSERATYNEGTEKKMDMSQKFSTAMHTLRKQKKMSLEELAQKIGTHKQMLSRYERGERVPKITMANKIAEALGTTMDEMFGIEATMTMEDQLVAMFRGLSLEGQKKLMERAEELTVLYGKKSKAFSDREAL